LCWSWRNFLQQGIVVSKVVNPKVSKLLLEITGHEESWRKDAMTEEVERSSQALIGSAFVRGSREVYYFRRVASRSTGMHLAWY
jgi:hypothetical protein